MAKIRRKFNELQYYLSFSDFLASGRFDLSLFEKTPEAVEGQLTERKAGRPPVVLSSIIDKVQRKGGTIVNVTSAPEESFPVKTTVNLS